MNLRLITPLLFIVFFSFFACAQQQADLMIYGGNIYTVDSINSKVDAVAVKDGKILATGSRQEMEVLSSEKTERIHLEGRTMIPGFIESHAHLLALGKQARQLSLVDIHSYEEMIEKVVAATKDQAPGTWILGRGWHQSKWEEQEGFVKGYQTHHRLSEKTQDHPVMLIHASGHALFANAKAMELAGVNENMDFGAYGEIIRNENGNPTGIFTENAMDVIKSIVPEDTPDSRYEDLMAGMRTSIEHGITSFQDAGSDAGAIAAYRRAIENDALDMRIWAMLSCENNETPMNDTFVEEWFNKGPEIGDWLTIRAVKLYADGALGSRGAWLLKEYTDRNGHFGNPVQPIALIEEVAQKGLAAGFQVCTHAIGDRANREVLDAYEKAFTLHPEKAKDHRYRIEHAQHLHPTDIHRFADLGVIASMQGIHFASDRPWAIDRLGAMRIVLGAYRWKQFLESGALVINGTDAPVEPVDPIACFYTTVTRKTREGSAFEVDQRLTREEALKTYTIYAAYGAFEEEKKGSIEPGKFADFTVLSQDIMKVPEHEILKTKVVQTIVNGEIVYKNQP